MDWLSTHLVLQLMSAEGQTTHNVGVSPPNLNNAETQPTHGYIKGKLNRLIIDIVDFYGFL